MLSKRVVQRLSPLFLVAFAGAASGQVVNWTGAAGPNWFDSFQSGACPNTLLAYFNGFGQIGCGGPVFPGPPNFVVVGAGVGPVINGSFTVGGMTLAAGGTTSWTNGDIGFGFAPGAGFSNSGSFLLSGPIDRSVYSSTISNAGTFDSAGAGILYFQTLAFSNSGQLNWHRGYWNSYTGTNSFTSSGPIDKLSADTFSISVATSLSGPLTAQAGLLQFVNTSVAFQNTSTVVVNNGATVNFGNCSFSGLLTAARVGSGALNVGSGISLGADFTSNVSGGAGLNWSDADWNGQNRAFANSGVMTLGGTADRSMYSTTFTNSGTFHSALPANLYFQTVAFTNAPGGQTQWDVGTWFNYTGTNSLLNQGVLHKSTPATFSTNVPSTLAGSVLVHQGLLQWFSTSINFQNPSLTIDPGAALSLNNCSLRGTVGTALGAGSALSMFGGSALSDDLTISASQQSGFNWIGGDWNFQGHTLTNGALLTISQNVDRHVYSGAILNNGTLVSTPPSNLYFQTLAVNNPGTIEWQRGTWYSYTGTNSFASAGTIKKTSADGFSINVPSTLSGLLDVQSGTVQYFSTTVNFQLPSNITLGAGAALQFNNCTLSGLLKASAAAGSLSMFGNTSLGNDLTLQATGGQGMNYSGSEFFMNGHTLTNSSLLTITGGDRSIYSGSIVNNGTIDYAANANVTLQTLAITNNATIRWRRGQWVNYTGTNSLSSAGTIEKIDADAFTISVPTSLSGVLNVKNGSVAYVNAPVQFVGGSSANVFFGASLAFNSCSLRGSLAGNDGGPGSFTFNTMSLSDDLYAAVSGSRGFNWTSGEGFFNGHTLTNDGLLTLSGGDRSAYSGTIVNNGQLNAAIAGGLYFQSLAINNNPGGTLTWSSGQFISYTGTNSISNQGLFIKTGLDNRPVSVPIDNSGEFRVEQGTASTGSFTQNPGATIRTSIYGPSAAGTLAVGPAITLHGNLAVYFEPSFIPAVNQAWTVLTSPSVIGTFDNIVPVAFPAGRQIQVTYSPTSVVVTLVANGCVGDLNHDGLVDDADFSIFVIAYNTLDCADPSMPAGCPADFNSDGVVDDADFVIFVPAYDNLLCP